MHMVAVTHSHLMAKGEQGVDTGERCERLVEYLSFDYVRMYLLFGSDRHLMSLKKIERQTSTLN